MNSVKEGSFLDKKIIRKIDLSVISDKNIIEKE
jgi:hypothetical protein